MECLIHDRFLVEVILRALGIMERWALPGLSGLGLFRENSGQFFIHDQNMLGSACPSRATGSCMEKSMTVAQQGLCMTRNDSNVCYFKQINCDASVH